MLSRLRSRHAARPADAGFTLIELVVSIAILGMVMVAVTGAMVVALRTDAETSTRLDESRDVQFSSTWFGDDVRAANGVSTSGSPSCGSGDLVVQFANSDITTVPTAPPTATPTTLTVSYVLRTVTTADGTFRELHRQACSTGPATDRIVARNLSTSAAPTVACLNGSGSGVSCASAAVRTVTLALTEAETAQQYTLQGTRRSS